MNKIILIAALPVGAWLLLGEPWKQTTNWLFPDRAAPWEEVVGFFYPDKSDLAFSIKSSALANVDSCRDWAQDQADENNDPQLIHGDYECGVGKSQQWNDLHVYRLVIK